MAGKSDFLEEEFINHMLRAGTLAQPANVFFALFTVAPADDGTGATAVTQSPYARIAYATTAGNWKDPNIATQGETNNLFDVVFAPANEDYGTINSIGVFDAVAAGNLLWFDDVIGPTVINLGDQPIVRAGTFTVQED